jgi:dnd system-associated protein 4
MDRRIAPPSSPELKAALEKLTSLDSQSFSLFETKQKALMFAAALGRFRGSPPTGRQRDAGAAIRFDIFEKAMDDSFVYAMAIAKTEELKVLDPAREEEVLTVFEQYAYAGLMEMNRKCFESGQDPLDALLNLTEETLEAPVEEIPGLDADILRGLMRGAE